MDLGIRYLFREGTLRPRLSSFYDAVLVKNNAEQLAALRPGAAPSASGSHASKQGLAQFLEWVGDARELAISGEIFERAVLEPFRLASRYAIGGGTAAVTGLVFYVSEPYYDRSFNADQRTVALIAPELRSAFSVRLRDRCAGGMSEGMYRFNNAKPIPLTNRLHLAKPSIDPVDSPDRFEEWAFLSVAMDDLDAFACSVEVEHYCEVPVYGSDPPRTLGAALTIAGRVEHVSGSSIHVRSATSDAVAEFFASGGLRSEQVSGLEQKHVKALVVKRYDEATAGRADPKPMEVFLVREIAERAAVAHDIAGHVRIRRRVPTEALAEKFGSGIDFGAIPGVVVRDGRASPARGSAAGGLIGSYLKTMDEIAELRASAAPSSGALHLPEDVLDPDRLSAGKLSKDGHAASALFGLLRAADFEADPRSEAARILAEIPRRKKSWLVESKCIAKGAHWEVTGRGLDVAYAYKKGEIGRQVAGRGVISVPVLEAYVPPRLLCRYLEKHGYRRSQYRGIPHDLIWVLKDLDPERAEAEAVFSPILREMSRQPHPLHPDALRDALADRGLAMSVFSLKKSLQLLVAAGDLSVSGDSYILGLEGRIALLLDGVGDGGIEFGDIVSGIQIPQARGQNQPSGTTREEKERNVGAALSALARAGKAANVAQNFWTGRAGLADLDRTRTGIISGKVDEVIFKMVQKRRFVDKDVLAGRAAPAIGRLCSGDGWRYDARDMVAESVNRLLERGVLERDGWKISLRKDS